MPGWRMESVSRLGDFILQPLILQQDHEHPDPNRQWLLLSRQDQAWDSFGGLGGMSLGSAPVQ